MIKFLSGLFKKMPQTKTHNLGKQDRDHERYKVERDMARSDNTKDRLKLAKSPNTHLEILYYLAEDQDTKVRRAVAANPSTPVHASGVLAQDVDVDVRLALIKRLTVLLPDLSRDQYAHLYAFAVQALGILALDEVLKVRLALSSALHDELYAPPEVVSQLARDLEREVSEPVLKMCVRVPDDVLIDILVQHPEDWVVEAIASRNEVHEAVSQAIIGTKNIKGGRVLLNNKGARLNDVTIDTIIDMAQDTKEWHEPLALNTHLPAKIVREIISFVDLSIRKIMMERTDFDDETKNELETIISRRINFLVDDQGARITPELKAKNLHKVGMLNDEAIRDALALREYDFVLFALSVKTVLPIEIIRKIIGTGSAKAVTAIVWKGGFEMRTALEIQKIMGKIPPRELLYPRNGNEYPLSVDNLNWHVNFFSGSE